MVARGGTSRGPLPYRNILLFSGGVAVALTVWAHVVNGVMPIVVDESVYIWQARQLAGGHLTGPAPQHPEFVNDPFLPIRDGRRFAQYPIGYPLALAPWVALGIPWAFNVVLGAVSLVMLFAFVRAIDTNANAWLAAALMAASPFFITQSTTFFSHPLLLALTLVAMLALERRERSSRRAFWAGVCGAAIGFAFNISPFSAGGIGLVAVDRWIATRRTCRARLIEVAAGAAFVAAGVGAFALVNKLETGNALVPAYYYTGPSVRAGFGEDVGGRLGYSPAGALLLTKLRVAQLSEFLFGWRLTSFAPAALYMIWRITAGLKRRRVARPPDTGAPAVDPGVEVERAGEFGASGTTSLGASWDRSFLVLLCGTVVIFAFWYFHGNGWSWGPRYLYTTIPGLIVLTARGFALFGRAASGMVARGARARARWASLLPWGLAAALFLSGTVGFLSRLSTHDVLRYRRAARELLDRLEADHIDRGTVFVIAEDKKGFFLQHALLALGDFSETAPVAFARDKSSSANRAFVEFRGGGPAYRLSVGAEQFDWRVERYDGLDRPYRMGRGQ